MQDEFDTWDLLCVDYFAMLMRVMGWDGILYLIWRTRCAVVYIL